MANDPQILGSDVEVLEAIAAGRCDVGLTNHYYLGRASSRTTPTSRSRRRGPTRTAPARTRTCPAPALVRGSEHRADAIKLMEYLTAPRAQEQIVENGEFAANPDVPPAEHIRDWADVKRDPIDVARGRPAAARRRSR